MPAGESYVYNNGRYRKEITVETCGHTIRVEGYLSLWPFLTVRGSGAELFRVCAGGDLRMVSIALDAGEDGTAVIQDEGAFLTLGSEEDMGLPAFSCTGRIVTPQTVTAAASWSYDCAHLPVVHVPDGADFSAGMLPGGVSAFVNRDSAEFEETVPVVWDETTFPAEPERTLVTGAFAQGYTAFADDTPRCLVVWESDEGPFFLNVYLEQATQSYEMVYMHGRRPGRAPCACRRPTTVRRGRRSPARTDMRPFRHRRTAVSSGFSPTTGRTPRRHGPGITAWFKSRTMGRRSFPTLLG